MKIYLYIFLAILNLSVHGQNQDTVIIIDDYKVKVNKNAFDSLKSTVKTIMIGENGVDTFRYFKIVDTNISKYILPNAFSKPKKWQDADICRKDIDAYIICYSNTFDIHDALAIIDTAKDFSTFCVAQDWCIKNYKQAFPHLVVRLSAKQKIGIENSKDLIIWERFETGEMKFYGHGGGMQEDIFTIAGRASWILNELTGENFALVHGNLTELQAAEFKKQWEDYIKELKE
jgi:hypothetical protein